MTNPGHHISVRNPAIAIVFLAAIQVLCTGLFLMTDRLSSVNSILFLASGTAISFFILELPGIKLDRSTFINRQLFVKLLVLAILLPFSYQLSRQIMDHTPLQIEQADMLPVMKTMSSRFLNGQWNKVYEPIPEIWNGLQPIYLPAFWMPFISSLLFHFDMRWITVGGIWLSVLLCIMPLRKINAGSLLYILSIAGVIAWLHLDERNNVIRLTEEGVVFFYYSLLVAALLLRNPWLLGISVALCLLSRYALIGWIPFAGLCLLVNRQYNYLLKVIAAGACIILLLVIIPFGWKPLWLHLQLPAAYIDHAARVWNENPEFYYQSPGMAKFFGPQHIRLLHYILTGGTFIIPLLFFTYIKKKRPAHDMALLSGLQLTLTFFYSFLDVSYLYLYYTPVFVSLSIAGWALSGGRSRSEVS